MPLVWDILSKMSWMIVVLASSSLAVSIYDVYDPSETTTDLVSTIQDPSPTEAPFNEQVTNVTDNNEESLIKNNHTELTEDDQTELNTRGTIRRNFVIQTAFMTPRKNMICSPVSALIGLGQLALGASSAVLNELLVAVGASQESQLASNFKPLVNALINLPGVKLDLANKIYVNNHYELNHKYLEEVKDIFQSDVEKIDLNSTTEAINTINSWIKAQTHDKISNLLKSNQIPPGANAVLVDAVYFKGEWQNPFEKATLGDFHSIQGTQKVPTLYKIDTFNYTRSNVLDSRFIEIPYKGNSASFVIVLPRRRKDLPRLLRILRRNPMRLNQALKQMKPKQVFLSFPKFKVTTKLDLTKLYKKIGVKEIFTFGLTEIAQGPPVIVSTAVQKAVIEVTETGTTAAAASGSVHTLRSLPPPVDTYFSADHPFFYFVKAGGEQLFAGVFVG